MAKRNASSGLKPAPVSYLIEVNADILGNFTYTTSGKGASHLQPNVGDTVSWIATLGGFPTAFQIEFASFGPFGGKSRVQRSPGLPTPPATVALPPNYAGNLIFEYTVTLENGWSDDPDVEPVPSVGTMGGKVISPQEVLLSLDQNGGLVIAPTPANFMAGVVHWRWDQNQPVTDDFTLTFQNPPNGWPKGPTQSQSEAIALNLPAGSASYTIQTDALGVSGSGQLNLGPMHVSGSSRKRR